MDQKAVRTIKEQYEKYKKDNGFYPNTAKMETLMKNIVPRRLVFNFHY